MHILKTSFLWINSTVTMVDQSLEMLTGRTVYLDESPAAEEAANSDEAIRRLLRPLASF
jgi:hypothetical protein